MSDARYPIGVPPNWMHDERRARELSRALHDYIDDGRFKKQSGLLCEWAEELHEILTRAREGYPAYRAEDDDE